MWCPLVLAYWFLIPTVDMCTINRCYSMFWSLRYSSVGLWLGHLEIAVGVYIDGHIDLQIKRTTGINWLDRLSRNVVFFVFLEIFRRVYITFCHVFLCFFLLSNGGVLWRYPSKSLGRPCLYWNHARRWDGKATHAFCGFGTWSSHLTRTERDGTPGRVDDLLGDQQLTNNYIGDYFIIQKRGILF
jgi:hypothetical protein